MTSPPALYYDPYDFEIDTDPYPVWKRLRDEAPLYYNERYDFYALSRFDDVEAASKDWRTFSSAKGTVIEMIHSGIPNPPGLFIGEDPPLHSEHRKILSRAVTPRRVSQLDASIREICAEYLDPFVGTETFDIVQEFAINLPMRVVGRLVGIPDADQTGVRDAHGAVAALASGEMPDDHAILTLGEPYRPFLAYKKEHPGDDFFTELIQAEFNDPLSGEVRPLSDTEILNYVGMVNAAGNETTTRLIGWITKALAEHPNQRAELVADPSLIPNAVEECLRYESPSPIQARCTTRAVELYGQTVAAGAAVTFLTSAANRDERKFDDPDRFDVHRKIDHHLAFGHGVHYCFGAALARIEGRIAVEEILRRFPAWELNLTDAELIHTSTTRGYTKLPIVLG